jgi:hypothetical protein
MKPLEPVQYLGSAAQGLGFFHVEVQEEVNRGGYLKFLDNCDVLAVEEGDISSEEIVENLQLLFDQKCHWQLRELEEFKFLVRFPPQKQISDTLISDVTYFRLKKEGVLVSLRTWTRDVEPYDTLDEVWVQIRGIPPKWSDWKTFNQIASSLGKMVEVDWNSLFSSFFSMVRVKLACKDATKIPSKRLFETQKKMYLVQFKVEKPKAYGDEGGEGDDNDNEHPADDDTGMEELEHSELDPKTEPPKEKKLDGSSSSHGHLGSGNGGHSKRVTTWARLFQDENSMTQIENSGIGEYSCTRLLKEMEALEQEDEAQSMDRDDEELVTIPKSWCEKLVDSMVTDGLPVDLFSIPEMKSAHSDVMNNAKKDDLVETHKQSRCRWGPTLVEKRPRRWKNNFKEGSRKEEDQ